MKQTTAQINRIVDSAYIALEVLDNLNLTRHRKRLYGMACDEERGHRRGDPYGHQWPKGASIPAAARFFAVKRIAEALTDTGDRKATVRDLIHWRPSAFYAASLVANYGAEILRAWEGQDIAALADLNYVTFVNNGEKA